VTTVAAVLLLLAGAMAPSVVVYDETGDRVVLCRPVERDEEIVLAFTNSMYGGDVRETYHVTRNGRLRRVAMHTEHPAAADYYAFTADVIPEGDLYRIDVPPAEYAEIAVRIDRVGAPRLIVDGGEIDLLTATGNQHRVILLGRPAGSEC
jgi:hypothetical protein